MHNAIKEYVSSRTNTLENLYRVTWHSSFQHPCALCFHCVLMPETPVMVSFNLMTTHRYRPGMQLVRGTLGNYGVQTQCTFDETPEQLVLTLLFQRHEEPFARARENFGPITLHQQPEGSLWNRLIEEDPD